MHASSPRAIDMAEIAGVEHLTPLDMIMPKIYTRVLLTFGSAATYATSLHDLQIALKLTIRRIPWLDGRLFSSHGPGLQSSQEIRWSADDESILLTDMGCIAASYDEFAAVEMPSEALSDHVWPPSADMTAANKADGAPVFRASIFRFAGGKGIGLCLAVHHNVVDAYGLAEIIRLWSYNMVCQGTPASYNSRALQLPTALAPYLKTLSSASMEEIAELHPEYSLSPQLPTSSAACTSKTFLISIDWITKVKKILQQQLLSVPTTNTILSALLWSTITRIRFQRDFAMSMIELSHLSMAVNGRKRIGSHFSTTNNPYLGNTILYSLSTLFIQELVAATPNSLTNLARVCSEISRSVSPSAINARHVAEVYSLAERLSSANQSLWVGASPFDGRNLMITSWADLDLYDMDFGPGIGKPDFVRLPYFEADGVCVIMPRKGTTAYASAPGRSDRAIEVVVMLRRDDMAALKTDLVWNSVLIQN